MISLDKKRCTKCGRCMDLMKGYCISSEEGYPVFDLALCNLCQKCAAVCPGQAIMVNNTYPDRISDLPKTSDITGLFERRRSIKHFLEKPLSRNILQKIVSAARYAPNQNKNISILVIDDKHLIQVIDGCALSFVRFFYNILFGFKPLTAVFGLFSRNMRTLKKKMEHDLLINKHIVKENTQALILLTGDRRVPVTRNSAYCMLTTIVYMAESLGIGNCIMDSLALTFAWKRGLRKILNISENVLGVLALGYSGEGIVNIPRGYEVFVRWN
jgi:nitroreductase/NAD-dependent dihydropyrimidine dehydrogenase PreA subunit